MRHLLLLLALAQPTAWANSACDTPLAAVDDLQQVTASLSQPWLTSLMANAWPDKAFDGQLQSVETGDFHDFDAVMAGDDPLAYIAERVAWRAPGASGEDPVVFISGLGQVHEESAERGRYNAEVLGLPWAQLHNASFLVEGSQTPWNGNLDWLDAAVHRMGLSDSPVIDRTARLALEALERGEDLTLAGDSHGTILLARALRRAKSDWVGARAAPWDLRGRARAEREFQAQAQAHLRVLTFGNGHEDWTEGPSYLHVYIEGDPLPERFGVTREDAPGDDHRFLVFDSVFPEGSFEAHNMKFSAAMLAETFERNGLERGDLDGLFALADEGALVAARPDEVDWPDMTPHQWDQEMDFPAAVGEWAAGR